MPKACTPLHTSKTNQARRRSGSTPGGAELLQSGLGAGPSHLPPPTHSQRLTPANAAAEPPGLGPCSSPGVLVPGRGDRQPYSLYTVQSRLNVKLLACCITRAPGAFRPHAKAVLPLSSHRSGRHLGAGTSCTRKAGLLPVVGFPIASHCAGGAAPAHAARAERQRRNAVSAAPACGLPSLSRMCFLNVILVLLAW